MSGYSVDDIMDLDIKTPIERITEYQCSAECNSGQFMKNIRNMIEADPDCIVSKRIEQIMQEQGCDDYLCRIYILWEYKIIDAFGWFEDAEYWYGKYRGLVDG